MTRCILCDHQDVDFYHQEDSFTYLLCPNCDLVFAKPGERLNPSEEKERYDEHENDPDDPRYRKFLSQLFDPMLQKISPKSYGLDFGSGPGPTLSVMFEEAGHRMDIFDPFYADNPYVFNNVYDFITTTETAEHLYDPQKEFERLWEILKPGGYLGIMTLLRPKEKPFADWHYMKDKTHVTFYSGKTFHWLSKKLNAAVEIHGNRVIILQKAGENI